VTVSEALRHAEHELAAAGVDTPRVDAALLLAHVLGVSRSEVYARADHVVPDTFGVALDRRCRREPLAYVLGEWGFRRLTLKTDARALVPRPETEIVVERALALLRDIREPRVLDVGVGSGAIALAIKDEHPSAQVTGVDTSRDALDLAAENVERLGLELELRHGGPEVAAEGWDLVVSNPPYVAQAALTEGQPELLWEPREALLEAAMHEEIARAARTRWLVFEVGDGQAQRVAAFLDGLGYSEITITRDLSGTERVVEGSPA
jgi:release factor glutamine methyltransferase